MISETSRAALAAALCKKGPSKGRLLATAPRSNTLAYAAWQGAMLCCNPFKASIAGLMFMDGEQQQVMREVESFFRAMPKAERIAFDKDRAALERLGVW
jgi:hypothetical protein